MNNDQQSKYKKNSEGILVSKKCTFCKLIDQDTEQIESREHLYLKCENSTKVLYESAEAMGIAINDIDTKGYEVLIHKIKENIWEELRENLFFTLYRFYIFKCRAGERLPSTNQFRTELRNEISMIIRCNAQSKNINDKLLPLWGGHELTLELAEKLRENDEETADNFK